MWVDDVAPVYTRLGTYLVSDDVWGLVDRQYVGWGFRYVVDTSGDDGWWLGTLVAVAFVWLVWAAFGGFGAYVHGWCSIGRHPPRVPNGQHCRQKWLVVVVVEVVDGERWCR